MDLTIRTRVSIAAIASLLALGATALPAGATQYDPPYADVFSFWYPNDSVGKNLPTKASAQSLSFSCSGL